jgi:hypothetical protein
MLPPRAIACRPQACALDALRHAVRWRRQPHNDAEPVYAAPVHPGEEVMKRAIVSIAALAIAAIAICGASVAAPIAPLPAAMTVGIEPVVQAHYHHHWHHHHRWHHHHWCH